MTRFRPDGRPSSAAPVPVANIAAEVGEGPIWHADERVLYWIDISPGRLYRFDPASNENQQAYQHPSAIGGVTIQADGSLLLFCDHGEIARWSRTSVETLLRELPGERDNHFNDVIADPEGRVFGGVVSVDEQSSRLYRIDPDGTIALLYDDLGLANGMDFSPDFAHFYLTDSNTHRIYRADYDRGSGKLSNRTVLVETPADAGLPDGLAVTRSGSIWSAGWDGRGLFRYSAAGDPIEWVPFPVRKVSSVAFGGGDLRTAYVTTAGGDQRGSDEGELAGSLFQVDLGSQGRAPFRSRLDRITP